MLRRVEYYFLSLLLPLSFGLRAQNISEERLDQNYKEKIEAHLEANEVDSALVYIDLVCKYYRIKDDYEGLLRSTAEKAELLRSISSLEESYKLLKEHQSLADRMDPGPTPAFFYNRLAAVAFEYKKEEALEAIRRSQAIDTVFGNNSRLYSNLNLEGALYRDLGQMESAKAVLLKTARYATANKDTGEYLSALYNLALTLYREKDYQACRDTSLRYVMENRYPGLEKTTGEMWQLAARSSYHLGDLEKAYRYLDSAHLIRLHDMERIVDSRVDAFKISGQLKQERLKNEMLEAENREDSLQILLLLFFLIMAVLVGIIIYLSRQRHKSRYKEQMLLNSKMQESLAFKNKLISIVAHDIRNPMASIKGMLQLFNQELVNPEDLKEWMGGLEVSVANVDLLLENLLNWVRSQSGSIEPHIQEIDLNLVVNQALQGLDAQLSLKFIKLVKPQEHIGHPIKGDTNILAFVLRNVLSNAFKFSPKGGTVYINCFDTKQDHCIEVKDEGQGIHSELIETILNGGLHSSAGTSAERGTGMGLALSQEFLAAMGGRLEIDSEVNRGTSIKIYIPR